MADPVWFWQRIVSPHMAGLADALAAGGREVVYVAEQTMSRARAADGWHAPTLKAARLRLAGDESAIRAIVAEAPKNSVHICQGLRANGLVGLARKELARRGLRQWVIMETMDEKGWADALLKRFEYTRLISLWRSRMDGVLAIGHAMPDWLAARGMLRERIFPFAYFLPDGIETSAASSSFGALLRIIFVGRLIALKRVQDLIEALSRLTAFPFELAIVGSGPEESPLRALAHAKLGHRVIWLGKRPIDEIPRLMATADCLVLPSRHDGWGAVVSEALMAGTPAICSDRCGSAAAVLASGRGGVFPSGNVNALEKQLKRVLMKGRQSEAERASLARWASSLGATAGAAYLEEILCWRSQAGEPPLPPWSAAGVSFKSNSSRDIA